MIKVVWKCKGCNPECKLVERVPSYLYGNRKPKNCPYDGSEQKWIKVSSEEIEDE